MLEQRDDDLKQLKSIIRKLKTAVEDRDDVSTVVALPAVRSMHQHTRLIHAKRQHAAESRNIKQHRHSSGELQYTT